MLHVCDFYHTHTHTHSSPPQAGSGWSFARPATPPSGCAKRAASLDAVLTLPPTHTAPHPTLQLPRQPLMELLTEVQMEPETVPQMVLEMP